jgi:uroporphyrinogen-III synthase
MPAQPLAGRRVLVTRAPHQAGKLSEGLRALGAEPVEVPVLEIQPPLDFAPLDRALRELATPRPCHPERGRRGDRVEGPASGVSCEKVASHESDRQPPYDWLILTSANTVRALAGRSLALGLSLNAAPHLRIAAVGDATATAARNAGFAVALVPETYVAESLIDKLLRHEREVSGHDFTIRGETSSAGGLGSGHEFSRAVSPDVPPVSRPAVPADSNPPAVSQHGHEVSGHDFKPALSLSKGAANEPKSPGALAPEGILRGQRFLIARAAIARDVIPNALRAAGATVDVVDCYRNVTPASAPALLREALQKGIAAAAFTSSSSVTHLADAARADEIPFPLAGVTAISIGPITSQTLRELGWEPAAEASPSDIPGLLQAVARALAGPL